MDFQMYLRGCNLTTRASYRNWNITVIFFSMESVFRLQTLFLGQHWFFNCATPALSPQMALGTGVLSRRFCRPFWTKAFWTRNLSHPWKVKPTHVAINAAQNSALLHRRRRKWRKKSQVFARHTLQVCHFKLSRPRLYANTFLAARRSDEWHVTLPDTHTHTVQSCRRVVQVFKTKRFTAGDERTFNQMRN